MDWQPDATHGAGEEPSRGSARPGPVPGSAPASPNRDHELAGFAAGGKWDACPPSATLAAAAEAASGPEWRCPGATDDELTGVLRRWAAIESWAAAGRLGVIREIIRREGPPASGGGWHGDLPDAWGEPLGHDLALALGVSVQSADAAAQLAWDLEARLPGIGARLADGTLSYLKALLVSRELSTLADADAATAEALVLDQLCRNPTLTPGQLARLAAQAAVTVDPAGAERRRQTAEKLDTRVQLWREQSGATALAGRNLPADEALAAFASVNARTGQYKKSKAFPGASMDQLRAMAYLDLLNGITAADRIANANANADPDPDADAKADADAEAEAAQMSTEPAADPPQPPAVTPQPGQLSRPGEPGQPERFPGDGSPTDCACRECDGSCVPAPDDDDIIDGDGSGDAPGGDGPSNTGPSDYPSDAGPDDPGLTEDSSPSRPSAEPDEQVEPPRPAELVIPLLTLLGLAERPGEGHGLGPLDPALCRDLALSAANNPRSEWCVTITDHNGFAIGHGCGRMGPGDKATWRSWLSQPARHGARSATGLAALPSRVNLTIPATAPAALAAAALAARGSPPGRSGPPSGSRTPAGWAFAPRDGTPAPGGTHVPEGTPVSEDTLAIVGRGTWALTLPGGRRLTVELEPVPTYECDHAHESMSYHPNDKLRHLVQVRDGDCTFPPCSRHARDTDFEHAVPYHKGGRTCACNAGARSRKCHRTKQSPGWEVTQPRPGWHQWRTPSGRIYLQEPKRYPALPGLSRPRQAP